MTSRHFYSKMLFNTMRRHLWYGAVLLLLFFIVSPLYLMIYLSNISAIDMGSSFYNQLIMSIGGMEGFNCVITAGVAMLAAWTGLNWLHNKKKMDLYGSLPVRREKLVVTEFLVSLLLYLAAYGINHLVAMVVCAAHGLFDPKFILFFFVGMLVNAIFYVLFYLVAETAMLLTGKVLVAILGTGVFLGILPIAFALIEVLHSAFFETYIASDMLEKIFLHTSPIFLYLSAVMYGQEAMYGKYMGIPTNPIMNIQFTVIVTVISVLVLLLLNYWLIRERPVEAAEKSMAFKVTEGPIKAVLLYVFSIAGGVFFYNIVYSRDTFIQEIWLWFGMIFTFIIGGILIDVIYERGIKNLFRHKISTAIGGLAAVCTVCFFVFDFASYDHWIPNKQDIQTATVYSDYLMNGSWWEFEDGSHNVYEYMERHPDIFNYEEAIDVAKLGIRCLGRTDIYDDISMYPVTVTYELKNGKTKKRRYWIPEADAKNIETWYLEKPERRKAIYPVLQTNRDRMCIAEIFGSDYTEYDLAVLSGKELEELRDIYLNELQAMDSKVLARFDTVGEWGYMYIMLDDEKSDYNGYTATLPFNEDFLKTHQFLQEKQVEMIE